jgi:hypothetical protein
MAADLILITGLPGGPFRLEVLEPATGGRWFTAAEMCTCGAVAEGPHWHDVTASASLADLYVSLLEHGLREVVA